MRLRYGSRLLPFIAAAGFAAGCAADPPAPGSIELSRLDGTTIAGELATGESVVRFVSSSPDQRVATLHLDVDGAALDFTYDIRGTLSEDGHLNRLDEPGLAALLALRDAVNREHPDLVRNSLHGMFLSRHADWLADAPPGYTVQTRSVDARDLLAQRRLASSTNNDNENTTCLRPGFTYTAFYDAGNGGQQWMWNRVANSGSCLGRCGAGCNIFDTDLMLDCFEHDTCVDHFGGSVLGDSPNCGDEFNHAVAEYVVTFGAWCPF